MVGWRRRCDFQCSPWTYDTLALDEAEIQSEIRAQNDHGIHRPRRRGMLLEHPTKPREDIIKCIDLVMLFSSKRLHQLGKPLNRRKPYVLENRSNTLPPTPDPSLAPTTPDPSLAPTHESREENVVSFADPATRLRFQEIPAARAEDVGSIPSPDPRTRQQ